MTTQSTALPEVAGKQEVGQQVLLEGEHETRVGTADKDIMSLGLLPQAQTLHIKTLLSVCTVLVFDQMLR